MNLKLIILLILIILIIVILYFTGFDFGLNLITENAVGNAPPSSPGGL